MSRLIKQNGLISKVFEQLVKNSLLSTTAANSISIRHYSISIRPKDLNKPDFNQLGTQSRFAQINGSFKVTALRHQSSVPSPDLADIEKLTKKLKRDLKSMMNATNSAPKSKAKRLKADLIELINYLPNGEFDKQDLYFIAKVVNSVDVFDSPLDILSPGELMAILRSVLPAMTLEDVRYIDFFPRFYNAMRGSTPYQTDQLIRLQLFEIFLNYVMLSNKRLNVVQIIDAFIKEEKTTRGDDVTKEVIDITLEAFKLAKPDTDVVLKLAELSDLETKESIDSLLSNFFIAGDAEIGNNYEENDVNLKLMGILQQIEEKVEVPLEEYINLLYFATKNSFDDCSLQILTNISKLTKSFTKFELLDTVRNDELFAIVSSALKFQNFEQCATKLIDNLTLKHDFTEFSEMEWVAYLQLNIYKLKDSNTADEAIAIIEDVNNRLTNDLQRDYKFDSVDTYNYCINALCYSEKSIDFVESFTELFDDRYSLARDAHSFATLIEYHLKTDNNYRECLDLFERSLEELVNWDEDYGGMYMPTLFKLLTVYCNDSRDDAFAKAGYYKKLRGFGFKINKAALTALTKVFLNCHYIGDAFGLFNQQTVELEDGVKFSVDQYPELFHAYHQYIITSKHDIELNWFIYEFLDSKFDIPYKYYPDFLQFFTSVDKPYWVLKIFANMKKLSKEFKLPPPNEQIYTYLFKAFGKSEYEKGVFNLHLSMKMDLSINLNMQLLNSLMEAYTSLQDPFKVRDAFNLALTLPREHGLNQESCYWMLKSLKFASLGHVKQLYYNFSQYDMVPDSKIFGEYLIANCYFEQYGSAFGILEEHYNNGDLHLIDRDVLKNMHNWCLNSEVRKQLDTFASSNYPEIWTELKNSGELLEGEEETPSLLESAYDGVGFDLSISDK